MLLPNQSLSPALGDTYVLLGFVTVIIGGLGNVRGAFVAALLMGLIESVSTVVFNNFPGLTAYVAMVVMLLVRPQGLFGKADNAASTDWKNIFRLNRYSAEARRIARARPKLSATRAIERQDIRFKPSTGFVLSPFLAALLLVAGVTAPYWANPGLLFIIGLTLIEALFALSWHFLFGYAGVVSFGHAAFFGIGAYSVGALLKNAPEWSFLPLLAGAGLLGAAIAWLVGVISLKRSGGIYLAILTMSLAEICRTLIGYSDLLGRDDGLSAIPRPFLNVLGTRVSLEPDIRYYWFLLIVVTLLTALVWWVAHSRFGRALSSIQQDPERASFIGINVARWQLWSFVLSGGLAAVSGACWLHGRRSSPRR